MVNTINYILIDAVEGTGITHWAKIRMVIRNYDVKYWPVVSFVVSDGAPDGQPVKKGQKLINDRIIERARNRIVNGDVKVRRDIAQQFVGAPNDWEYDNEGVDALIQVAFFGEIVYG